jgi:hypothetical protein
MASVVGTADSVGAGADWKLVPWCEFTIGRSSGEVGGILAIVAAGDADAADDKGTDVGGDGSAGGVEKAGRRWRSCVAQQWHWHVHAAVGEKCGSVTSQDDDDDEALRRAGAVAAPSAAASTGTSSRSDGFDGDSGSGGERRAGGTAAEAAVEAGDESASADSAGNEEAWRGGTDESPMGWAAGETVLAGGALRLDDDGDDDEEVCAC